MYKLLSGPYAGHRTAHSRPENALNRPTGMPCRPSGASQHNNLFAILKGKALLHSEHHWCYTGNLSLGM